MIRFQEPAKSPDEHLLGEMITRHLVPYPAEIPLDLMHWSVAAGDPSRVTKWWDRLTSTWVICLGPMSQRESIACHYYITVWQPRIYVQDLRLSGNGDGDYCLLISLQKMNPDAMPYPIWTPDEARPLEGADGEQGED